MLYIYLFKVKIIKKKKAFSRQSHTGTRTVLASQVKQLTFKHR